MARPASVLYLCSMNAIRSPMAAMLTRHYFPTSIYVASAGVRQGQKDPFVDAVMEETGIDMSAHEPTMLEYLEDGNFELMVTLSPQAHHRALEFTRTLYVEVDYWPTQDPSEISGSRAQILDAYRSLRDSLAERIKTYFA